MLKKEERTNMLKRLESEFKGYNMAFYRAMDNNNNKIMLQILHEENMRLLKMVLAICNENGKIIEEMNN